MYGNAARGGLSHGHTGDLHKNFVKIGPAVPEICSRRDRQTVTHTDKLIAIQRSPTGVE